MFSTLQFEPKPKSDYPFQSNLSTQQFGAESYWHNNSERFGYGVIAKREFGIARTGNESIGLNEYFSFGAGIEGAWTSKVFEYLGNLNALVSSMNQGVNSQHQLRWHSGNWMGGLRIEGELLLQSPGMIQSISASLLLGHEF